MVTKAKKTIDDQIAAAEAALKRNQNKLEALKAKKSGSNGLTSDSPGMIELLALIKKVCNENNCNNIDLIKAVVRMKKLPVKINVTPKKTRVLLSK